MSDCFSPGFLLPLFLLYFCFFASSFSSFFFFGHICSFLSAMMAQGRPGISNLVALYAGVHGLRPENAVTNFEGMNTLQFKEEVTAGIIDRIAPIRVCLFACFCSNFMDGGEQELELSPPGHQTKSRGTSDKTLATSTFARRKPPHSGIHTRRQHNLPCLACLSHIASLSLLRFCFRFVFDSTMSRKRLQDYRRPTTTLTMYCRWGLCVPVL